MVLPAAFPNLLANGSQGIAVGMATAIPPHNAAELCDAALHLIDNPNAAKTLLEIRAGPGFSDRRRDRRSATRSRKPTRPGAARSACARAGRRKKPGAAPIRSWSRKFPGGAEGSAAREIRRAAQRQEAAVRCRRARRVRRGRSPGHRAACAHGRSRAADGIAV